VNTGSRRVVTDCHECVHGQNRRFDKACRESKEVRNWLIAGLLVAVGLWVATEVCPLFEARKEEETKP